MKTWTYSVENQCHCPDLATRKLLFIGKTTISTASLILQFIEKPKTQPRGNLLTSLNGSNLQLDGPERERRFYL